MTPRPEENLFAAAEDGTAARLELIDRAKANGATWAVIGATLGMSKEEAKRHARRLRDQARRASLTSGR